MMTTSGDITKTQLNMPVLRAKYDEVRATSRELERIIEAITDEYTGELDKIIESIDALLDRLRDDKREISERELQRLVLRLPAILYRLTELVDRSAIESDVAKAAHKIVYASQYQNAPEGTIPERTNTATLATADETQIVDLAKHVHGRVKGKFEVAMSMFDAVRKVMTSRDNDKQAFRRDR